jgi:hypothetical protein
MLSLDETFNVIWLTIMQVWLLKVLAPGLFKRRLDKEERTG